MKTRLPGLIRFAFAMLPVCLVFSAVTAWAQNGRELIEESILRHQPPPYVYQEQTLILSSAAGQNTVRTLRYYARRDASGVRRLAVIHTPEELRGLSVLVTRDAKGNGRHGPDPSSPLFGSNLSVADFEGERPVDFNYDREDSQDLDRISHYVLRATPIDMVSR